MTGLRISRRGGTTNWTTSFKVSIPDTGPMTKEEYQHACTKLVIKDSRTASELFGLSWRTCQRYWYGELLVPPPLARLLRLAVQTNLSHAQLRKLSTPLSLKVARLEPTA